MERLLSDIVEEIAKGKKTGILSISVKNDSSLFKVFFRNGAVYHATHGTCKDMDCVKNLGRLEFDTGFFHLGATVDITNASFPPTDEIIERIRTIDKTITWSSGAAEKTAVKPAGGGAAPAGIDDVERELVNIVGPIAPMLIENAYSAMGIRAGQPVPGPQLTQLIAKIADQLPEDQRSAFLGRFS